MPRKKTEVGRDERERIVALKQRGHSWLSIQNETLVDRRVAKRVYEEWQRNDEPADITKARIALIKEELSRHVELVIRLGHELVESLSPPPLADERSSEEAINDVLRSFDSAPLPARGRTVPGATVNALRHNRVLMDCLAQHLGQTSHWRLLEQYTELRDRWLVQREQLWFHSSSVMGGCSEHDPALPSDMYERQRVVRRLSDAYLELLVETMSKPASSDMARHRADLLRRVSFEVERGTVYVEFGNPDRRVAVRGASDAETIIESVRCLLRCTANGLPGVARGGVLTEAQAALTTVLESYEELSAAFSDIRLRHLLLTTKCKLCE